MRATVCKIKTHSTPRLVDLKNPSQLSARMLIKKIVYFRTEQTTVELTSLNTTAAAADTIPRKIKPVLSSRRSEKRLKTCERTDSNRCDWLTLLDLLTRARSSWSRVDAASCSPRTSLTRRSSRRTRTSACTSGRLSGRSSGSVRLPGSATTYLITAIASQNQTRPKCSRTSYLKDSRATMMAASSALVVRLCMREGTRSTMMLQAKVRLSLVVKL